MIQTLGPEGMSDDESAVEDGIRVLKASVLRWRRPMSTEMQVVDQTIKDRPELLDQIRSVSVTRITEGKTGDRVVSTRAAYTSRPESFYSSAFLGTLYTWEKDALDMKDDQEEGGFEWFTQEELEHAHDR